jgi:Fur family iron response transcriptional regulator
MDLKRSYSRPLKKLTAVGLRPTSQRMILAKLLFDDTNRHVTAEILHKEALNLRKKVSLATVYNTLHLFTGVGLLREIVVDAGCIYFDTNTTKHHHFYCEDTRELIDIDGGDIQFDQLPKPPFGQYIREVDIIVRVKKN